MSKYEPKMTSADAGKDAAVLTIRTVERTTTHETRVICLDRDLIAAGQREMQAEKARIAEARR